MNTTILDQIIEPFAECLTPEAARKIVAIRADEELQGRVDALADKANAGTLTEIECHSCLAPTEGPYSGNQHSQIVEAREALGMPAACKEQQART
jgi:hypothetical protein